MKKDTRELHRGILNKKTTLKSWGMTDDDPDECGDDATELFNDLESRRSTTSSIPLFASDGWDPFKKALKKKKQIITGNPGIY